MDFVFDLLVPLNTLKDDPEEAEVDPGTGIITLVEIEIPRGCKGMVSGAVSQGIHQVWPSNTQGAYHSDGRVYSAREHYRVKKGDAPFLIHGWSPGTTYSHNVQFRFTVLPLDIAEPWRHQESVMDVLLKGLGLKKVNKG